MNGRAPARHGVKIILVMMGVCSGYAVAADQEGAELIPAQAQSADINQRVEIKVNNKDIKAIPVNEEIRDIDGDTPPDSYYVGYNGVLNMSGGAIVDAIEVAGSSSRVNIDNGTVRLGLYVRSGEADVNRGVIRNSEGVGLTASISSKYFTSALVNVRESTISGFGAGVLAGPLSTVTLSGTDVFSHIQSGRAEGIRVSAGSVILQDRSYIESEKIGIRFIDNYVDFPANFIAHNRLTIDNSTVRALDGAAIVVDTKTDRVDTEIDIRNNSSLLASNGVLLDVSGTAPVNFNVDNSNLTGNLIAKEDSNLNITLQNHAQLTGDIVNSKTLAINSGAHWQMVGDGAVNSLAMDGGRVSFADSGFYQLSLKSLSGNGVFNMRVNLDAGVGDLINVEGQANGEFGLQVQNTGSEAVTPELAPLRVVHTEGGDARFSLLGGRVDLGAYSYLLEKQGTDWFIVGEGKTISPSTQSALALFNAAPVIWMSELSTLRSRMGEVRESGQGGGWMRAYGNRFNATTSDGVDYQQKQSGLSFGADAPVPVANGQLLLGVMGGYSKSDLDLSRGTSGKVDSYYIGAYGTWLSEDGLYLDGVLKLNRFRNASDVAMSDSSKAKGDYANSAFGGSLEVGKHIKLGDDWFLEPFAQLAAVHVQGDNYRMDNGLQAKNSGTQSVLGKVGSTLGRSIRLKDGGLLQPYVRVAAAQEFSRSNDVTVNDTRFDNNLFGSRAEIGAGVAVSLSERLQLHADFDYMKGKRVEQPWGANIGLRFAF